MGDGAYQPQSLDDLAADAGRTDVRSDEGRARVHGPQEERQASSAVRAGPEVAKYPGRRDDAPGLIAIQGCHGRSDLLIRQRTAVTHEHQKTKARAPISIAPNRISPEA